MALNEKVYGVKTPISPRIFSVNGVFDHHPKSRKPVAALFRNWQPQKTSAEAAICQR